MENDIGRMHEEVTDDHDGGNIDDGKAGRLTRSQKAYYSYTVYCMVTIFNCVRYHIKKSSCLTNSRSEAD